MLKAQLGHSTSPSQPEQISGAAAKNFIMGKKCLEETHFQINLNFQVYWSRIKYEGQPKEHSNLSSVNIF